MDVKTEYISIGGNRHPSAADWDTEGSGLLAFGADNCIALWDPLNGSHRGIKTLLNGHSKVVNAVRFFRTGSSDHSIILSGSADETLRIWKSVETSPTIFEPVQAIAEHQGSITSITVLPGSDLFVTGAADGTVKVWALTHDNDFTQVEACVLQTIELNPRYFPQCLALARLDESSVILAVGGTKTSIQIFVSENRQFHLAATLTGHEGWIRSLAFTQERAEEGSDLILASASQDKYIRLWRIHQGEELPAVSNAINDPALGVLGKSLSNKAHRIESASSKYTITFEALLLGHEDWVYTSSWRHRNGKLQLLSTSEDNSVAIWEPDLVSGVWVCIARLGEISAQKGSTTATGSAGGFWVGLWSPDGNTVVSLGRTGSWRMWTYSSAQDMWLQEPAITGHVKEVKGICWSKDGAYLLSTGSDQTTRLFAEWSRSQDGGSSSSWHEFARPQIHGYDLNCIGSTTASQFISGADEKLLRVFDEPRGVAEMLNRLCRIETTSADTLPDAANIPVLGLSNKAVQAVEDDEPAANGEENEREAADPASTGRRSTLDFDHPPFEDHLSRHLLWPETEKLYGHGYEISAVATSKDGKLVATACRASSIDHAVIRLYDTKEWLEARPPLTAHSLTVTSLEFSHDDRYLLSVGRDRQWAVFERDPESTSLYRLALSNPKGHTRMILDGSWAPSASERTFATAGRDKSIKIWQFTGSDVACKAIIPASSPVTAIAFLQQAVEDHLALAYGTEDGTIGICSIGLPALENSQVATLDRAITPAKTINQLTWRAKPTDTEKIAKSSPEQGAAKQLAVASDDNSVRIYGFGRVLPG